VPAGFTVMVAVDTVKPELLTHVLASVTDVIVYPVVLPGLGVTLKGVPLTTPGSVTGPAV
jgi:hypothetical protein